MQATPEEMQEAAKNIPEGKNSLMALFEAAREYEKEVEAEARKTGMRPSVCFNRDGLCEDDHCRCWDALDAELSSQK